MKNHPSSRPIKRKPTQAGVSRIVRELESQTEEVAVALLGEPSKRLCREFRWRQHGSLWLCCAGEKRGRWYDHERGEGGDLLDLIARERDVSLKDAITIASDMLGAAKLSSVRRLRPSKSLDDDTAKRTAAALRLWHTQSVPINGTPAENYFAVERQLAINDFSLAHALRWHGGIRAIVALMTDPVTGEAIGIHRTFLDGSGKKLERRMLGRQGVIRVSPDDAITTALGVTEGVEDALAVVLSGWCPIWAATSAGAIARLPLISGIESLTIFADADEAGVQAAESCCDRWRSAGREARIVSPEGQYDRAG